MIAPKLRFSQFKDEWKSKKLGEIGEFINGLTYSPSDIANDENQLLVLRSSNIQDSQLAFDDNVFVNLIVEKEKFTQENDILICVRNGSRNLIGKNTIIKNLPYKATHGAFMSIYRSPFNSFIVQLFQTDKYYQYINADLGATINSINGSNIKKYKFYFPSEKEQTKIAEFLSAVDDKINQLNRQLELLNQYKKGVMQKIFSQEIRFKNDNGEDFGEWDEKELNEIFDFSRGEPLSKNDLDEQGQYDCIHYGELFTKYNEVANRIYSKTNKKANKIGKKGYILMPSSDVTPDGLARATCLNKDEVYLGGDINVLKPKTEINSIFFSYLINSDKSRLLTCVAGTTVKHIYNKDICGLIYNFPSSIQEQEKIAGFLTAIDERIDHTTAQLTHTKQWKKGLLQQMFV